MQSWDLTQIEAPGGTRSPAVLETVDGAQAFEPGERHSVGSEHGAQIILLFSPWPGEGHYPESDPWTILD